LEFAVPINAVIPIKWPGLDAPPADADKPAYILRRLDRYFLDAARVVNARLANFAPDVIPGPDGNDTRHPTAQALDPFIHPVGDAARAARTVPDYLLACYERSVHIRGKTAENRFIQALMLCSIALAKRGACTLEKAGKISKGVLQDTNMDFDVDPEDLVFNIAIWDHC
jgi:hypothetical protein